MLLKFQYSALPFFLLAVFAILCISSIYNASLTYDEPQHYRYGAQLLIEHNAERFDDSKMPASAWNAVPRAIAIKLQSLLNTDLYTKLYDIKTGRYMTILVALVLGFFVFRWSKELYGIPAGYFSLFLYSLSPNIIAHASLITTDLYSTAGITIALYYYWRFLNNIKFKTGITSAFAFGFAQITKYTAVFLYPIFLIIAGIFLYKKTKEIIQKRLGGAGIRTRVFSITSPML